MKLVNHWEPALPAWTAFCEANPQLGLIGGKWSWTHLIRKYRDRFIEAGVLRQTTTGRYLLHAETFPAAAFEILSTGPVRVRDAKAKHQEAA